MSGLREVKVCPSCREEFRLEAARCSDCGETLVFHDELPEDVAPEELPPASELVCIRVAPLAWIRTLSESLQRGGVAHRVEGARASDAPEGQRAETFGNVRLFGLYVTEVHAARTRELDAGIAAQLLPEESPELPEGEEESCPACGTALLAEATECPDCGLGFG